MTEADYPDALPAGHRLHWYVLEHVLGQGGFGITYLARDSNLDRRVAIKEYLPSEIARRRSDAAAHPRTEAQAERYAWGLERFLAEARTLARFDHPNIVRVHSVFEANNTAYMVMRFEEGENLAALVDRCGTLSERQLTDWLLPVLDGLALVHASGFIHRDIKPENIYLRRDGSPVLLDFGSARQAFGSTKTMTILVAPGYAPLEQYYNDAATQGAWTDIYGLGATCYRSIAGRAPLDAIVRAKGVLGSTREVLPPAVEVGQGRYNARLLVAIDHALQLGERDRPQSVAEWRREILGSPTEAPAAPPAAVSAPLATAPPAQVPTRSETPTQAPAAPPSPRLTRARTLWPAAIAAGTAAGVATVLFASRGAAPTPQPLPPRAEKSPRPADEPLPPRPPEAAASVAAVTEAAAPVALPRALPKGPTATADEPPPRVSTIRPAPAPMPALPRSATQRDSKEAPAAAVITAPSAVAPAAPSPAPPAPAQVAIASPIASPVASVPSPTLAASAPPRDDALHKARRSQQIDNAESAWRRGDHAAAARGLEPWAAAGVARAQLLMGQVQESRPGRQRSDFEAYVWYGVAARGGEAAAAALRDKVAARLQPAEVQQADRIIEGWQPRSEPPDGSNP